MENKVKLMIDVEGVVTNPVLPPRRGFLDMLPDRVLGWCRKRGWFMTPTKFEEWYVNAMLAKLALQDIYMRAEGDPPINSYLEHASAEDYEPPKGWN